MGYVKHTKKSKSVGRLSLVEEDVTVRFENIKKRLFRFSLKSGSSLSISLPQTEDNESLKGYLENIAQTNRNSPECEYPVYSFINSNTKGNASPSGLQGFNTRYSKDDSTLTGDISKCVSNPNGSCHIAYLNGISKLGDDFISTPDNSHTPKPDNSHTPKPDNSHTPKPDENHASDQSIKHILKKNYPEASQEIDEFLQKPSNSIIDTPVHRPGTSPPPTDQLGIGSFSNELANDYCVSNVLGNSHSKHSVLGGNVVVYNQPQLANKMIKQNASEESNMGLDDTLPCDATQQSKEQSRVPGEVLDTLCKKLKKIDEDSSVLYGRFGKLLNEHDIESFIKQSIDIRNIDPGTLNSQVFTTDDLQDILGFRTIRFSEMPKSPVKISEASFSEVFSVNESIYKIIPFNEYYAMEAFSKEVFVLNALKREKGVCRIVDGFLVKGKYSKTYLKAWEEYKNSSENSCPSEYKRNQVFGVIAMNDCGEDMEKYQFRDYSEIQYFVLQLLSVICNLEKKYKFEHRDLHWGNIMIKDSEIFLIDFNFVRLETTKVVYTDLNKEEWLFEGDQRIDPQFGVYRKMKESCSDDWVSFNESSNLLWIVYLLGKLHIKIVNLKTVDDKSKSLEIVQLLENKAKNCKNTRELLDWFERNILNANL